MKYVLILLLVFLFNFIFTYYFVYDQSNYVKPLSSSIFLTLLLVMIDLTKLIKRNIKKN